MRIPVRIVWVIVIAVEWPALASGAVEDGFHRWIFFRDKGISMSGTDGGYGRIPASSLAKRRAVRPETALFDASDRPLVPEYIAAVAGTGAVIRVHSRWLNAVSVLADADQLERIRGLDFVSRDRPVAFHLLEPRLDAPPGETLLFRSASADADYGPGFEQAEIVRIPPVHDIGLTGKGVIIGMLDDGFQYRDHPAFKRLDIVAEHDFYDGNDVTSPETGDDPRQGAHGTGTLSVIGGFDPGELIGPAYGASYALAKTEWIPFEKKLEEDKWVAGLEWLVDTVGVDIVSSSLGYDRFPDEESDPGYDYADMNGRTCVTTVAADMAVSRGVVVVNSAGNEFDRAWHYISSPADGDSVIAVGAVNRQGTHAYFSSCGPTSDGRIKPDVSAFGNSAYHALAGGGYGYSNGTSYACPMVAGICALMLEAHPGLTPAEVMEALKMTASQADRPDTLLGWGIADAYEAVFWTGPVFRDLSAVTDASDGSVSIQFRVYTRSGNAPLSAEAVIWLDGDPAPRRFPAVPAGGEPGGLFTVVMPETNAPEKIRFYLSAVDIESRSGVSPLRAPDSLYAMSDWMRGGPAEGGRDFTLRRSYPNPFSDRTTIECDVLRTGRIDLDIVDGLGRRVKRFAPLGSSAGRIRLEWDGKDANGRPLSSGLYFLTARSRTTVRTLKLLYFQEGRAVSH
jgi:serine protease AprX